MAYFSEQERISLLMMQRWDDHKKSYNKVRQIFNKTFRDKNTAISRPSWSVRHFNETDSVKNPQIPGWPILTTCEEKQLYLSVLFDPSKYDHRFRPITDTWCKSRSWTIFSWTNNMIAHNRGTDLMHATLEIRTETIYIYILWRRVRCACTQQLHRHVWMHRQNSVIPSWFVVWNIQSSVGRRYHYEWNSTK